MSTHGFGSGFASICPGVLKAEDSRVVTIVFMSMLKSSSELTKL